MTIRSKILAPIVSLIVLAITLMGFLIWQAANSRENMQQVTRQALEAQQLSFKIASQLDNARALVAMAQDMTTFVSPQEYRSKFDAIQSSLGMAIDETLSISLNEEMRQAVFQAQTSFRNWSADAAAILGLKASATIPTKEKINRRTQALSTSIDAIVQVTVQASQSALDQANSEARTTNITSLTIAIAMSLAGLVFAWWSASNLTRPILTLTTKMADLASGKVDEELNLQNRSDEIGKMQDAVIVFRENALARRDLENRANKERESEHLKQQRKEEVVESFRIALERNVGMLSDQSSEMRSSSQRLFSVANHATEEADSAGDASASASENVQTVASAAEELSASIESINEQSIRASTLVHSTEQIARDTDEKVVALAKSAEQIGEVLNLIRDIADQTNLLALNATIEAARAGEMGRGFAVVATEVKTLASQTAKATEDISRQISGIQSSTRGTVESIGAITSAVKEVSTLTTSISDSVSEQQTATAEIARAAQAAYGQTDKAAQSVSSVSGAISETTSEASAVNQSSELLARVTSELSTEVDQFLSNIEALETEAAT